MRQCGRQRGGTTGGRISFFCLAVLSAWPETTQQRAHCTPASKTFSRDRTGVIFIVIVVGVVAVAVVL